MPELAEFLEPMKVQFRRKESREAMERYMMGLLSEHPNKNCETMAEVVAGSNAQQLQGLLTQMVWDEEDLNRQRVEIMQGLATEGDGALLFDDTGFAKKGRESVGVAAQYSGTFGKVGNCQVSVNCHYAERTIAYPISSGLYLPQEWVSDVERRKRAQVPEEVVFQTKAEIALGILDQANSWGVKHACVVVDSDYGDNPNFLNGLEERQEGYVVAIRSNFSVILTRAKTASVQRVDQVLEAAPRWQWRTIRWREGSQGWLRAKFVAIRCWRVDGDGSRHIGWLIGQRPTRGEGEWKYFWSNFSATADLAVMVEYTHRRHWVEQFHEEAKTELGWDQYQGRLWSGFHRNAALVMLSYCFLVWLEWQQRLNTKLPGKPRAAFSPSQRPSKKVPSLGSSSGHRVAT